MSLWIYLLCLLRYCHPYPGRIHWLQLKLLFNLSPEESETIANLVPWSLFKAFAECLQEITLTFCFCVLELKVVGAGFLFVSFS